MLLPRRKNKERKIFREGIKQGKMLLINHGESIENGEISILIAMEKE